MSKGGKPNGDESQAGKPDGSAPAGASSAGDVFDIDRIRHIVELMEQHDLGEVDLQQGDEKIKLKRGASAPVYAAPAPMAAAPAAAAAAPANGGEASDEHASTITINAPMVGTFYSKANPESEPFVKVGTVVNADTVCCIVEAMKVFNEIPAECSGKIVEVLVEDQQPVDFGKPLFRVLPSGN